MAVRAAARILTRAALAGVFVLPFVAACATARPASDLPGPAPSAVGADAGVRLEVRPGIAHPRELERPLTALFVIVENKSPHDLRISPDAFTLAAAPGRSLRAISPEDLRRSPENPVETDIAIAMRALPMNMLDAGGKTDGFLYFDEPPAAGSRTLTFELRSADGAGRFGSITIPLVLP